MALASLDNLLDCSPSTALVAMVDVFDETIVAHRTRSDRVASTAGRGLTVGNTAGSVLPPARLVETYVRLVSVAVAATLTPGIVLPGSSNPVGGGAAGRGANAAGSGPGPTSADGCAQVGRIATTPEAWSLARFYAPGWEIVAYRPSSSASCAPVASSTASAKAPSSSLVALPPPGVGGRWVLLAFVAMGGSAGAAGSSTATQSDRQMSSSLLE